MKDDENHGKSTEVLGEEKIKNLIGKPLRVYKTGDSLTLDLIPNRVNIEVSGDRHIVSIWEG